MIDGGFTLIIIGVLLIFARPAEKALAHHRAARTELNIGRQLTTAYPIAPPSQSLEQLVQAAETALESDARRRVRPALLRSAKLTRTDTEV